jgi:hypothetical protein
LKVKIPTTASEEVSKYLLHKAIYYYYLDEKHPNPLFRTSEVSCFESSGDFNFWYNLWAGGSVLPKNC